MKKFQFTLQQLLKLRQLEVSKAQEELKKLQDEYQFLKSEILFLERENHYYKDKIAQNTLKTQEKAFVPHYLAEIAQVLAMYQIKSKELEKKIVLIQKELLNAVNERKKIEKLKEKQYALWQTQEKIREDHYLDDICSNKNDLITWIKQKNNPYNAS